MSLNKVIQWTDHHSKGINLYHAIILSSLFAILSIFYHHGGVLHPEMNVRLPFYFSSNPLLNKLFDSNILDDGFYRARELSYLLDFLDSKFVEFSIENGFPHFLSLTHYLFSIAIGCLVWLFCVKEIKLHPLLGAGFLALFWTSPSVFLGGGIFRTGKIGVTLLTAILVYIVYRLFVISKKEVDFEISRTVWFLYSITIVTMTLLDEQGLFLNVSMLLFLTLWALVVQHKNNYILVLISIASIFIHVIYRYIIAPQLTYRLNGYWPSFSYQNLPLQEFFQNLPSYMASGVFLYVETFRSLIGHPPQVIGVLLLIFFISFPIFYLYMTPELSAIDRKFFSLAFIGLLITNLFLVIVMNTLMILRHPALMWVDVRLVYYWLPTNIMLTMTLPILTRIFIKAKIPKWFILTAVFIAIIGNSIALPEYKGILLHGCLANYFESSSSLLVDLKEIESPDHKPSLTSINNPVYECFSHNE